MSNPSDKSTKLVIDQRFNFIEPLVDPNAKHDIFMIYEMRGDLSKEYAKAVLSPAEIADRIYNSLIQGSGIDEAEEFDQQTVFDLMKRCEDHAKIILGTAVTKENVEAVKLAVIAELPANLKNSDHFRIFDGLKTSHQTPRPA